MPCFRRAPRASVCLPRTARPGRFPCLALAAAAAMLLSACSPKFDWREVQGADASYTVLLPAKPASATREINLGGVRASMTMTGAEVDGATFAVGMATLPDAQQALTVLPVMRDTMVNNIRGTVRPQPPTAKPRPAAGDLSMDVEAAGSAGGQPRVLYGRFVASGRHVYQAIAVGPERSLPSEAVETFLDSFKPGTRK